MSQHWSEYFDWLEEKGVRKPQLPAIQPVAAKPALQPLHGIKVVLWDVYGSLLRISDGALKLLVDDEFRMQIALEKTLEEFAMWQSMTRKPGAPWKYLLSQYRELCDRTHLAKSSLPGDFPTTSLCEVWDRVLERLLRKEYEWDHAVHGERDRLVQHIAFFYHQALQGVEVNSGIPEAITRIRQIGICQALFGDAEIFSLPHLMWLMNQEGGTSTTSGLFDGGLSVLSYQLGLRKSSQTFYKTAVKQLSNRKIRPEQVLCISTRLKRDLEFAKRMGWRTALLANDKLSLNATAKELKDPSYTPDRLLTSPEQAIKLLSP